MNGASGESHGGALLKMQQAEEMLAYAANNVKRFDELAFGVFFSQLPKRQHGAFERC
jgi:hypothetical protein